VAPRVESPRREHRRERLSGRISEWRKSAAADCARPYMGCRASRDGPGRALRHACACYDRACARGRGGRLADPAPARTPPMIFELRILLLARYELVAQGVRDLLVATHRSSIR